jgi:hypothetical protein
MKMFAAVLAVVLALGAIYAVAAPAGQQGVSPAKVAKLAKQVKRLKKQVHQIQVRLSCFSSVVPVTQYNGYTEVGGNTALDVTRSGDSVGAFMLTIDPSCVQGAGKAPQLFKLSHALR